jgi:pimeloyl-ACP methyl ester carboxylesterase
VAPKSSRLTDAEFVHRLTGDSVEGVFRVQTHGGEIPMEVTRRRSTVLIVTFAGTVNRQKSRLPQFGGRLLDTHVPASVIRIADPSLPRSATLKTAWYAGHEGFETQLILPELLQRVVMACGAKRVIFLGGSAGGFAALYYSWRLPQSIVIATNPQTDVERFWPSHIQDYRASCRPNLGADDELSSVIATNVVSCYAQRVENTVVYLQNAADSNHVRNHFAPFLAAIDVEDQRRILPRLAYWGKDGHAPVPAEEWLAWLRAAIASPSNAAEDIQRTRKERGSHGSAPSGRPADSLDCRLAAAVVERARARDGETAVPSTRRSNL